MKTFLSVTLVSLLVIVGCSSEPTDSTDVNVDTDLDVSKKAADPREPCGTRMCAAGFRCCNPVTGFCVKDDPEWNCPL